MANALPESSSPVEHVEQRPHRRIDGIVEVGERDEEADGEHGAGHGVADGGHDA